MCKRERERKIISCRSFTRLHHVASIPIQTNENEIQSTTEASKGRGDDGGNEAESLGPARASAADPRYRITSNIFSERMLANALKKERERERDGSRSRKRRKDRGRIRGGGGLKRPGPKFSTITGGG